MNDDRERVVDNIKTKVDEDDFNDKVEFNDPTMSADEEVRLLNSFVQNRGRLSFKFKEWVARSIMSLITWSYRNSIKVVGTEKLKNVRSGAIITSNHFNPYENLSVRKMIYESGLKQLDIVSQATNLKMTGFLGFIMKYDHILPIGSSLHYQNDVFLPMLGDELNQGHNILIYPEQEMWFNYRKPRPLKRGAYYYACKFNVPIISCFVKLETTPTLRDPEKVETHYTLYVLDPIYPDPTKNLREESIAMMNQDYQQKVQAYEKAYGKKLDYTFDNQDIAGYEE